MDDSSLAALYLRTTLELRDDSGNLYRITPTAAVESALSTVSLLEPFSDAFILTAENPESSGEYSDEDNHAATATLQQILSQSRFVYRDCPGYAFDSNHVEQGFALFARPSEAEEVREFTISLAESFRQNAIFHLDHKGLAVLGALRPALHAVSRVVVERA